MLLNFNTLSLARYEATVQDFHKHTALLTNMKKDLDSVFQRIRSLKDKLSKQHPHAFKGRFTEVWLWKVDPASFYDVTIN